MVFTRTSSSELIVIAVALAVLVIPATPTPVKAAPDIAGKLPDNFVASNVLVLSIMYLSNLVMLLFYLYSYSEL